MRQISKKTTQLTLVASFISILVPVISLAILSPAVITVYSNEILLFAILIIVMPSAVLDFENQRWISAIEDQMPLLVRGVSESQETGLTLVKALEKVVDDKMIGRPLSDEIRKLTIQMSWGVSFEQALTNLKDRVNSPVVSRFCALVLEASRSGGTIKKVFTATAGFMEEMKDIDKDTSAQMKPYVVVIYAAFAVFLVVAVLLVRSFLAPAQGVPSIMGTVSSSISLAGLKDFFYKDMLISAVTGGLMAGKLAERRVGGGLKHAIILTAIGYVLFFIAIPPAWM
jgi:flagellar protein FlaJ